MPLPKPVILEPKVGPIMTAEGLLRRLWSKLPR
jgi:hypothetical protein